VHLEADLHTVVQWTESNNRRWAFSKSNAGAYYTRFFKNLAQLDEINWEAVAARDFRPADIKEGKQAEFLLFNECPNSSSEWVSSTRKPNSASQP
jgi:hypothetical protein